MLADKEIFQKAFAIVSNPETFNNNGGYACDADGESVSRFGDEAVRFCSIGAIDRVTGFPHTKRDEFYKALSKEMMGNVAHFNDTRSHSEVVAAWRRVGEKNGWL